MKPNAPNPLRRFSLALAYCCMIALMLAGGLFAHSSQMTYLAKGMQKAQSAMMHHAASEADELTLSASVGGLADLIKKCRGCPSSHKEASIHCGAAILGIVAMPLNLLHMPKADHDPLAADDLVAFAFAPDPPPPRLV